ncbi:MAG: gamma-glutamyltransferase [Rhodothermales bacterium]
MSVLFLLWMAGCTGVSVDGGADSLPVQARNGVVVSADERASQVGIDVLRRGGNAIDAAVATGFALAVVHPSAGNLGGGGFMVIRLSDGHRTTIDYREKAPAASTADMYLDADGEALARLSREGYPASGVPGSPAGLLLAHAEYGRLPLADVLAPAIRLAEDGFRLSGALAASLNVRYDEFSDFESTRKYFTKENGRYASGELFVQEDLADVLRRIRDGGRDGFYTGRTAEFIVAEMERGGGLITLDDLAAYEAVERAPVVSTYRDHRIVSMPPPSSGGVALAQLLNAVEPYDVAAMGFLSAETVHLMGEAMRRVYADRAQWLGDPDYFDVPVGALISKTYMQRRMETFDPQAAASSEDVTHGDPRGDPFGGESTETTHYSVVDADGNAVSTTTTINASYGSKVVVDGAGFFLNNEMDDFAVKPGVPNMYGLLGSEANAIEPGKRMLSSMTPTIVEDPDGDLLMVIGSPGGGRIITIVLQTILNVVDHGMNVQQAVDAGRVHHQWRPDVLEMEPGALSSGVQDDLRRRGWSLEVDGPWGRADGIVVRRGIGGAVLEGGADPRGEDVAVGY